MEVGLSGLPEGCVSHVLSLTSPHDTCRSAATSSTFRSAAESDEVWEGFLPSDYREILSNAVEPVAHRTKKELYLRLCDPVLIDGGRKSFALEKSTGKKTFTLSARDLTIIWGETPQYWRWISLPESRFSEVAELLNVCWLEITGKIDASVLSKRTTYTAYLIFKLASRTYNLHHPLQEASILVGSYSSKEMICLDPSEESPQEDAPVFRFRLIGFANRMRYRTSRQFQPEPAVNRQVPRTRADGWMEIFLGEFFNDELTEGEVQISLLETKGGQWKAGLIVEGIELRPKVEIDAKKPR